MTTEFARSPSLPHLEARRSCAQTSCYRPHAHDAFSVGLVERGSSLFSAPASGTVRLHPGDVVVIAAGQVHRCNPDDGAWEYRMVHVNQEWAVAATAGTGAASLFSGVAVVRDGASRQLFLDWSDQLFEAHDPADLERGFRDLAAALAVAVPAHSVVDDVDPALRERVRPVLQRLRDDEANPRLEELASLVGLSTFQLVRAVHRVTGLAPLAWRQNARITRARELLRQGRSISATAQDVGFADQSHFHRVFRAHVAATPRTYRG